MYDWKLMFFPTSEGYVSAVYADGVNSGNPPKFAFVTNIRDHLGNLRMSITRDNNNAVILQERHYYPFGLLHQGYNEEKHEIKYEEAEEDKIFTPQVVAGLYKYWYQEQERQTDLDLNWDSFKYRNYDYAIGRFMSVDPLAEKYPYNGVYNFSENKVVAYRELEGLESLKVIGANDSEWYIIFDPSIDKHYQINLSDYNLNLDIGNLYLNLNLKLPDAIGIDINLSASGGIAGIEGGINFIWHPKEESFLPEVFIYDGEQIRNETNDLSAAFTISLLVAMAYDKEGNRLEDLNWINDGRNWTGDFFVSSLSLGEELVISGSYFTSSNLIGDQKDNYWSGFSFGVGIGMSSSGGALKALSILKKSKIKDFIKSIKKGQAGYLHKQTYWMIYGNGGEGWQEGFNWFYKK